jgi:flagellar biosynthesis/type III secretory pathway protein FliH
VGADAGHESGADHGAGHAVPTSPFETAQAAYDRGYGDGVVAGREAAEAELRTTIQAEFEAKLADKINAFETALTALAKPQTVDTSALFASLQAAVVRLAAARTGAAIDQLPELIITRIEHLADTAGKHVAAGHVFMHPDDCAVISPILAARQDPMMIVADPALHRGDIRIRFDGMEIDDLLDQRVGLSQPAASPPPENIADQPDQTPPEADDETES